jgi:hypothetical protein
LVSTLAVSSFAESNRSTVVQGMARDDDRRIERRPLTVGEAFELEAPWLGPHQLVDLGQTRDVGNWDQMPAAEPADLALDPPWV